MCYIIKNIFDVGNGAGKIYRLLRNYQNTLVYKIKEKRRIILFPSQTNCQKVRNFRNKLHLFSHSSSTSSPPTFSICERKMAPTRTDRDPFGCRVIQSNGGAAPPRSVLIGKRGDCEYAAVQSSVFIQHAKIRLVGHISTQTCPQPRPLAPCCP